MKDAEERRHSLIRMATKGVMSFQDFLNGCRSDPGRYASIAERMIKAIGEPEFVDTAKDARLARIFDNRTLKIYPAFKDFYGLETVIEQIVGFFRHAAQGLEEKKQILYLLGPVGGGKSSLADRLRRLAEQEPIYTLAAVGPSGKLEPSPIFESPLWLFDQMTFGKEFEDCYGIPARRFLENICVSPWAVKRLEEFGGDWKKFQVMKFCPSLLQRIGVVKTEPGDENNQDISTLVGKVNIRMIEQFNQHDADAYSYSGSLNRTSQGILEFVEMFKAPLKMLHPLLTATQDGNYAGTENVGAMPYQGLVIAHSNEAEWQSFRGNKNNEAFLDRVNLIKVPYVLRYDDERMIYEKLISRSELAGAPCADGTLKMLAQFAVLTRIKEHENSNLYSKMRIYNGESLKDKDPHAKTIQEYRDAAGVHEGMDGMSTRFGYKVLSETFNFDTTEVAADPVHLMYVLEQKIRREQLPEDKEKLFLEYLKEKLVPLYAEYIGKVIQRNYIEAYHSLGQNLYDRYIELADAWTEDRDYKDPDTGTLMKRETLEQELSKMEKPASISNPKDFRFEVVKFTTRYRGKNNGKNPDWTSYQKMREVVEARMFTKFEDLVPVISFGKKQDAEMEKKHSDFVARMVKDGYTPRQTQRLVEWYMRVKKSS